MEITDTRNASHIYLHRIRPGPGQINQERNTIKKYKCTSRTLVFTNSHQFEWSLQVPVTSLVTA